MLSRIGPPGGPWKAENQLEFCFLMPRQGPQRVPSCVSCPATSRYPTRRAVGPPESVLPRQVSAPTADEELWEAPEHRRGPLRFVKAREEKREKRSPMNSDSKNFFPNESLWADWQNGESAENAGEVIKTAYGAAAARPATVRDPLLTGGAPPPAVESEGGHQEKRRKPRFKCEGSMELKTEGSTIHTWATFTDVSSSGCYVEIMTTFPVGTLMDLRLGMHGIMVETRAVVRVTYPFLGMGIEFTDVSPTDRERLEQMLASLAGAFAQRLQMPEPKSLQLSPITDPGAVVEALARFFAEKSSLTSDEFVRLVQDSQLRSM